MLVGDIDSVCLVLAYFKNTLGTKVNKLCGEAGRYRQTNCKQACTEKQPTILNNMKKETKTVRVKCIDRKR